MPPLDPNISLQFRLPSVDNPLQIGAQAQTLRQLMLQNQALEQTAADAPRLREMEMAKQQGELQKQQTDIDKNTAEILVKKVGLYKDQLASINDQNGYSRWRSEAMADPHLNQWVAGLPEQFTPELKLQLLMKADDAVQQLSTTAAQELTAETSRRGQDIYDVRQREANQIADATRRYTAGLPVTPVTIQDPRDPNATQVIDARTRQVLGKGPKLTDIGKFEAKRQFNMQGIGATIQAAENILTGKGGEPMPTESGVGTAIDYAAALIGVSPSGSKQADQMRALGGALVAKMPRMEGPQSDKDVALYRESAGRIGDSTIPIARRKAALETVKELWTKYERLNPDAFAGGVVARPLPAEPTNQPGLNIETAPSGSVFDEADAILNRGK
jgi:hypothetical protein